MISPKRPRVSFHEFQGIVEGANSHPTFRDLQRLAQEEAAQTVSVQSKLVADHLRHCVECQGYDERLKTLPK